MPDSSELLSNIIHYQKSLDKYSQNRNDAKILHCIFKLFNMPVTISHLEKTGIGRTVNALRKLGGEVGDAANTLVKKWKDMVSEKSDCEDNANESEGQYKSQNYRHESNSSHTHSDKSKNSDRTEKSSKNDKHKSSKKDRYDEVKQQSTSERKQKCDKRNKESKDKSSFDSESIDSESGIAFESDQSSSSADNVEDGRYEHKYTKHKDSSSERSSKYRQDIDKERKREKSYSKEDKKESRSEHERKQKRHNSSSSDSNEQISRHSSNKSNNKRKHDNSPSDEERKSKTSKRSSHKSSKQSSRQEHKKESRSDSDIEISSHDFQKTNHKSKDGSSREHKKETKLDSHKKEYKNSSKSDPKSERRREEPSKEDYSRSDDKSKKDAKKDRKTDSKDKPKNKSSRSSNGSASTSTNSSNSNKIVDIWSESGTSFAEALGMLEPTTSKIGTKKIKISEANLKLDKLVPERNGKEKFLPEKMSKVDKIDIVVPPPPKTDIDLNIACLLPSITPNYRPVANPFIDNCSTRNKIMNDDEALRLVMSQKNQRTKVYSGNKSFYNTAPTLFELCIRILQDNIDALEYTGGVPYAILKPILDKATPDQLFVLEHHNPYLIEDSDGIWQFHCQKEFRNKKREEMETWRDMYMRCLDEREAKLKALTENIKLAQDKSIPVRQTKLAYVDSVVKPPRDVLRKQAKSGIDKKPAVTPSARLNALATSGAAGQVSVPNPVKPSHSGGSTAAMKPKKAPLMQKTLAFMKGNRFRR